MVNISHIYGAKLLFAQMGVSFAQNCCLINLYGRIRCAFIKR
jgi:hypothetical protein